MYRTIKAQFVATCKRCGEAIAVGQSMRYGGRGRTYHLKSQCPMGGPSNVGARGGDVTDDEEGVARGYHNPRAVSHYTRFSSGAEVFVNKRGRCEDAPCCGCCS